MTEEQWLTATEPREMLEFLRNTGRVIERKAYQVAAIQVTPDYRAVTLCRWLGL